jgi:hypothetical protein
VRPRLRMRPSVGSLLGETKRRRAEQRRQSGVKAANLLPMPPCDADSPHAYPNQDGN